MSADLVAFLRARLKEDEKIARDASGPEWEACDVMTPYVILDVHAHRENRAPAVTVGRVAVAEAAENRAHIARHDPKRILAEVQAKRRVVEVLHHEGGDRLFADIFRLLALPFADHPDYREEWRP